jgi:hypothetical protein
MPDNNISFLWNRCNNCDSIIHLSRFTCCVCGNKKWDDGIVPALESEVDKAGLSVPPLPEGWTLEDLVYLKDKQINNDRSSLVLVADTYLGLETIHGIHAPGYEVQHLGWGCFRLQTADYTVMFDGGGAMDRTPSGKGWTWLTIQGEYPEKDNILNRFYKVINAYLED